MEMLDHVACLSAFIAPWLPAPHLLACLSRRCRIWYHVTRSSARSHIRIPCDNDGGGGLLSRTSLLAAAVRAAFPGRRSSDALGHLLEEQFTLLEYRGRDAYLFDADALDGKSAVTLLGLGALQRRRMQVLRLDLAREQDEGDNRGGDRLSTTVS